MRQIFFLLVQLKMWLMQTTFAHLRVFVLALVQLHQVGSLSHLRSAADELSKATYGAPNRPGANHEQSKSSLIIYIIHISPSIPAPVILLSPNPTSFQINKQGGHQYPTKALVPMGDAVNLDNITATCRQQQTNRRQDSESGLLCSLPAASCEVQMNLEQRVVSHSLSVSLSLLMFSLQHLCYLAHTHMP